MKKSVYNNCIYYICEGAKVIIVATWVDDKLFFTSSDDLLNMVKSKLSESFPIKFLGVV